MAASNGASGAVLFTVGYEGRSLEAFIELLQAEGVTRVIDVRELPLSRRKGFSKTRLREALEEGSIEYVHLRSAGNPYRSMKAHVAECLRLFREYLLGTPNVVDDLEALVNGSRSALLCVEARADCCHRSILVDGLRARNPSLPVRHL